MPLSILGVLPVPLEVMFIFKENISRADLATHVHFYKAFPLLSPELYGSRKKQRAFWESVCLLNGLGVLDNVEFQWPGSRRPVTPSSTNWKKVAFNCIDLCGSCDHPACGIVQLERNGAQSPILIRYLIDLLYSAQSLSKWRSLGWVEGACWKDVEILGQEDLDHEAFQAEPYADCHHEEYIHTSSVFKYLRFERDNCEERIFSPPIRNVDCRIYTSRRPSNDAWLYHPGRKIQEPAKQRLADHPIAARSFAILPVMRWIQFTQEEMEEHSNDYGITVWGVQSALRDSFHWPLSRDGIEDKLDGYFYSGDGPYRDIAELAKLIMGLSRGFCTPRTFMHYFPQLSFCNNIPDPSSPLRGLQISGWDNLPGPHFVLQHYESTFDAEEVLTGRRESLRDKIYDSEEEEEDSEEEAEEE
ncbi:hypothetical protein EIP91_002451 [Steccherinum ochraceum]|uniref:Uncharacterized protein n=1 Tax=Steccherinum ochraceum TaxID=92696 RepID=A0A4R0RSX5_9APHY|nr:hypothetical protein EIP91_002451 [Steccherinum ochraceum]